MTGLLKPNTKHWIICTIQLERLPNDIDFIGWRKAHQDIMIDKYFMSLDKDIRHDIMCEIDGFMINSDVSPISEHSKRSYQQSELLLAYLLGTVSDMMSDYDSRRVERVG